MRIFDCFLFDNELDILEVRLKELCDVVDRFVLVESSYTFQGNKKPLCFAENALRFSSYNHKIRHVVDREPVPASNRFGYDFSRQQSQMAAMTLGLADAFPEDLIIISDVDEIPSRCVVQEFREGGFYHKVTQSARIRLAMKPYRYYFECVLEHPESWIPPAVVPYWFLKETTPWRVRTESVLQDPRIPMAGWHLSWFGGIEQIIHKMESNSDTNHNQCCFKSPAYIKECLSAPKSLFNKPHIQFRVENPSSLPDAVEKDRARYPMFFREGVLCS